MNAAAASTSVDRPTRRRTASAPVAYICLAVLLTWPWAREIWDGRVDGDATQFVWDAWWVQERVFALKNPWHTDALFAPEGTYLTAHPLETLLMVLVSPLTAVAGPMTTYGVLVLATLAAAGLLAYRLALSLGLGTAGAAVTGALWASSPIVTHRAVTGLYMLLRPLHAPPPRSAASRHAAPRATSPAEHRPTRCRHPRALPRRLPPHRPPGDRAICSLRRRRLVSTPPRRGRTGARGGGSPPSEPSSRPWSSSARRPSR